APACPVCAARAVRSMHRVDPFNSQHLVGCQTIRFTTSLAFGWILQNVGGLTNPQPSREEPMKLRFTGCVYAAALLIGGATGALAQDKTFGLKLSHWVPPSCPLPE